VQSQTSTRLEYGELISSASRAGVSRWATHSCCIDHQRRETDCHASVQSVQKMLSHTNQALSALQAPIPLLLTLQIN